MECLDENAVLDFLEGRLAQGEVSALDEHLSTCDECRSLVRELGDAGSQRKRPSASAGPSHSAADSAASSLWLEALAAEHGTPVVGPPGLVAGARIGERYLLSHQIGVGGMGVVWAAQRAGSGESVALKFLKTAGRERARRFLREARIAASLKHPNIVTVHEILTGAHESAPVIVMELLAGESLATRLRRCRALGLRQLADILLPVIDAVAAAHAAGVVHRDLKPENVFLVEGATVTVKVVDFGIAKRTFVEPLATTTPDLTQTGAVMGTPYYMAPEQMFGEKTVDARADVWALGVVLYECVAGRRPIDGENFGQVLKNATLGSIRPLASIEPNVPEELSDLVGRMLSRDPAGRPSLSEVSSVVARCAAGEARPSSAAGAELLPYAPTVAHDRIVDVASTPSAIARSLPPRAERAPASVDPRRRGRRVYLGAAGTIALLAVGLAAWRLAPVAAPSHTIAEAASASPPPVEDSTQPEPPAPVPVAVPAAAPALPVVSAKAVGSGSRPRRAPATPTAAAAASAPEPKKLAGGVEKQPPY
jgi:serine/threonine-protein kinase